MSLTRLPQSTVRLLGSSQVITSVSSVVKELMENSFDAGASNIEVRLEKHGLEKIEVRDDGVGIIAEDCLCMALPHYTSKITDFSDLERVQSYGFRGEALYSLCTLASVNVITRTADDEMARSYLFDNAGNVVESKISHGLQGTTVIVTGLFKNIPVRRQVMSSGKRVNDELKKVENIVKSLAVIHPRVRVSLAHNKFLIWQKTSVAHLKLSVMQILNHTITRQLHHIVCNTEQIKIELLIPKKDCDIQTVSVGALVDTFRFFINKRPVRDKKIEKIFSDVFFSYFGLYMPPTKFPVCFVAITVPPDMLDVNLEPNKTKVFIKNQDKLLEYLKEQLNLYYCDSFEEEKGVENCLNYPKKRKAEPLPSNKACKSVKSPSKILKTDTKKSENSSSSDKLELKPCENNIGNRYDLLENNNCNGDTIRENTCNQLHEKSVVNTSKLFPEINGGNIDTEDNLDGAGLDSLSGKSCESMVFSLDPEMVNYHSTSSSCELSQGNDLNSDTLPPSIESTSSKSSLGNKDDLNEELSLSQWSRGNTILNKNKVQASSVLLNHSAAISRENRNFDSMTDGCEEDFVAVGTQETSGNSNNIIDELERFLDSEEGNQLLQKVTSSDVSNGSNKKSNILSEKNISDSEKSENRYVTQISAKKEENHVNINDSLNRSVSSQMGRKEMSAFTKFAREMRSEILKESPGMTFTLVASTLASKWKNLQAEERGKYEKVPINERAKKKEIIKSPDLTGSPKVPKTLKRHSVSVNVAMNFDLEKYFERYTNNTIRDNIFEIVGQIESSDLWTYNRFYDDKLEVGVLSLKRLHEAYMFHQNMGMMSIPVKNLEKNICFYESDLGPKLWNVLINLEFNFDENTKTKSIIDKRIVMNGFRIQLEEDSSRVVFALLIDVAMNINFYGLEDLRETLKIIESRGKDCCIAESRCLNAIKYIRSETIRQCQFSTFTLPRKTDVLKLLSHWWNECQNFCKCNFGKDVILSIYNIAY